MTNKKTVFIIGIAAIFFAMSLGTQAYAGGGTDPGVCPTIGGPEIWGVVVVGCENGEPTGSATVRVKRIVDCNVETFSFSQNNYDGNCPADATAPINTAFPVVPFPGITNDLGQAAIGSVITKVKNLKTDPTAVSYDAQFRFCFPNP